MKVVIKSVSTLAVSLLDGEGRLIRVHMTPRNVPPGNYFVEWDGMVADGMRAQWELPYVLRVSANDTTYYVKVIARQRR